MQPVVSHEVIPETHRNGHQTHATLGLMAGFALMMTLDTALGLSPPSSPVRPVTTARTP